MFEQHPVPQQIASYQFRLVGDMTLKQFLLLGTGAVLALLIYSLPLNPFIRWPLVIFSAISGAAFAFLPIQERPLEQWVASFIRAVYQPTIYKWDKNAKHAVYFAQETTVAPAVPAQGDDEHPPEPHLANLENTEKKFLSNITGLIGKNGSGAAPVPAQQVKPILQAQAPVQIQTISRFGNTQPQPPTTPKTTFKQPPAPKIVMSAPVKVAPQTVPAPAKTESINMQAEALIQTLSGDKPVKNTAQAQFSQASAPPSPPETPNTVVGQVFDKDGRIVETAILEIKDEEGRPVRAFKTNKVGHFRSVTPLPNGKYTITTEKSDLKFEPISLIVSGEIVQPIVIKAQNGGQIT